jgi:hypothetical protein
MRGFWIAMTAAAGAAMLAATPASAATVLNVNWNSDCGKSTCFNDKGVFTQTWSSAGAHGPMTIGQFLMDRGILGALDDKTFRISFSVGGQELGTWGSYNMAGIGGDELNFDGLDFVWNPEDGDLVLTLEIVPPPKAGGGGFFSLAANQDAPPVPGAGGDGPSLPQDGDEGPHGGGPGGGVVVDAITVVPEPATWAMMIAGFGLAGASLRQRRRVSGKA